MLKRQETYQQYIRSVLWGVLSGLLLAIVFSAGFFLRDFIEVPSVLASTPLRSGVNADENADNDFQLLFEVQNLLDQHYLRSQPDNTTRQYAAIRGLLSSLDDRNTFFIEPPVARSESDVLAGTYGGIGVSLQRNAAGEFVLYPFEDGPAAEAGIEDGDILIAVNDDPLDGSEQQDAVDQLLRGEVTDDGNGVELTIRRNGAENTVFIAFDVINVPSVMWRVLADDERLGYIQILRFTSRTPEEIEQAVVELETTDITALILDLRNNSGGLLRESVDVASLFLDGGVVLYEETARGERSFDAETGGVSLELPLVILVNRGTASAAELVAGALQDRGRGILIGQTTFGKGTIQQIFPLSDSSSIHVTSAEWFTPNRNALDGVGLEPDIAMIPDEDGRDVEIGEAIRYLREQLNILEE